MTDHTCCVLYGFSCLQEKFGPEGAEAYAESCHTADQKLRDQGLEEQWVKHVNNQMKYMLKFVNGIQEFPDDGDDEEGHDDDDDDEDGGKQ